MIRKLSPNVTILFLVILLTGLLMGVGYASFSDILNVSGTANAKGTFNLEFQNVGIVEGTANGINLQTTMEETKISEDGNTLTVSVMDIAFPGAGVDFTVDIVNKGTIPAKLKSVIETNVRGIGLAKITGLDIIGKDRPTLEAGETYNLQFRVEWDSEITDQTYIDNLLATEGDTVSFNLDLEYIQKTEEIFNGAPAHDGETEERPPIIFDKDNPTYEIPTQLTAIEGQTLADVKLPEGFKWNDPLDTSVGPIGKNPFKITFTPDNTENFNILNNIEVFVKVSKKAEKLTDIIKGQDYGKNINYSVEVNGKTYNDWKVLYNDGSNVQIIISDFLPQEEIPQAALDAGLEKITTEGYTTYNVNSTVGIKQLTDGLTNGWEDFAKGNSGIKAVGATTKEIMEASFQGKYGTTWNMNTAQNDSTGLYVSHKSDYHGCRAYWLASAASTEHVWFVYYLGNFGNYQNYYTWAGVRPVVTLKSSATGSVGDSVVID